MEIFLSILWWCVKSCCSWIFFQISRTSSLSIILTQTLSQHTAEEIECRLVKSSFFNIIAFELRWGGNENWGNGFRMAKIPSQVMECRFFTNWHILLDTQRLQQFFFLTFQNISGAFLHNLMLSMRENSENWFKRENESWKFFD